ncbi:MAG: class I SAM-dependent methyltransferase [Verrucomicrobiota bacterium]
MRKIDWIELPLLQAFAAEGTTAHRLCTAHDGWVERFGSDILISFKTVETREHLRADALLWAETAGFSISRIFGRYLPKQNAEREAPILLWGDDGAEPRGVALECGLRYGIDFSAGYSVGLFVDQRENRRYLRRASPTRLLNCFAYTCAFSIAAATAGGTSVNVDLSRKSLQRGRENFQLNDLPTADHQFVTDDVLEVLPRLARRGEKFDGIVLDPPTFSRSHRGKAFQIEADFERLLLLALEVAHRPARILLSTNCRQMNERMLEVMARFCLKTTRAAGRLHREPSPTDFPPGAAASTLWLLLS